MTADDQTPTLDVVPQMWCDTWRKDPERSRTAASKAALRVIETFAGEQREALWSLWERRNPSTMFQTIHHFHDARNAGVPEAAVDAVGFSAFYPPCAAVRAVIYFGKQSLGEALEERQRQRRDLTGQDDPPALGSDPADEQPITDEPHTPPDTDGEE